MTCSENPTKQVYQSIVYLYQSTFDATRPIPHTSVGSDKKAAELNVDLHPLTQLGTDQSLAMCIEQVQV